MVLTSMLLSADQLHPERLGLSTLEDISKLILQSRDLDETLTNIVRLVAKRMQTEVCSIYLSDQDRLTLRATIGLSSESVGHIHLALGEGLIGYTAASRSVVNVDEPQNDPRFRFIEGSNEEIYHSFLGIPLYDRHQLIGVMAIQTIEPRQFDTIEISTLSTIAFQLSSVVASARLLDLLDRQQAAARQAVANLQTIQPTEDTTGVLHGEVGFAGVAIGPAMLIDQPLGISDAIDEHAGDLADEFERLDDAFEQARIETLCLEKRVAVRLSEEDAAIFHSHLMILQDRLLIEKIRGHIHDGRSAAAAVKSVVVEYVTAFRNMDDPYLRERAADMEDIGRRLLAHLLGRPYGVITLSQPSILVAKELLPSDIALMDHDRILGLVLQTGDSNSHAVIIAKSLGIPTLIGIQEAPAKIEPGVPLILDGNSGCLHIAPSPAVREEYRRLEADSRRHQEQLLQYKDLDAVTSDGVGVTLRANIGLLSDVEVAHRYGAQGVGLYRTEFPFMARSEFPDRQTQYDIYRRVVESFWEQGEVVTIRTLDIGGDKMLSYFDAPQEENPFLGWRSIRISLDHRELFRTQIEAILMAATHGSVKMMFPMVTTMDELLACKEVVAEARANLEREGWQIPQVPLGVMIEVPAAITMADHFAREVDFFSLGTNDLIQYMLAADRGNSRIHHLYDSLHPAVLMAIAQLVQVALRHDKPLCICGEMASDPACFAMLVGMGLREFSVSSPAILSLKARLAKLSAEQLQALAQRALTMSRSKEIRSLIEATLPAA